MEFGFVWKNMGLQNITQSRKGGEAQRKTVWLGETGVPMKTWFDRKPHAGDPAGAEERQVAGKRRGGIEPRNMRNTRTQGAVRAQGKPLHH